MVRREEAGRPSSKLDERPALSCASPAGASPAPVGVGAPGSRPQPSGRDSDGRAGRRKPLAGQPVGRKQARGPQHEVKPAASTEVQSGSRAAHFTAKATSVALDPKRAAGPGGVWGAARVQGEARNTGDPSWSPLSRQGCSYKPKAKSSAAKRESEGLVVLVIVATNNATGGKELCFGHARSEGKREGMAAKSGPTDPDARSCVVQVQRPQGGLWTGAKRLRSTKQRPAQRTRSDARVRGCGFGEAADVHAPSRRPSVSRVPEIGTHGLKGGSALSPMNNRSSR
jgi:hypothetical protein